MTQHPLLTWNPQQVKSPNLCSAPRHDKARLSITNTTFIFSAPLAQFARCCCLVTRRLTWFCNTVFLLTGLRDNPALSHLETPYKNTLSIYGVPLILAEVFMDHGSHSTVSCIPAGWARDELNDGKKNHCNVCNSKTQIDSVWSPFGSGRVYLFSLWFSLFLAIPAAQHQEKIKGRL